MSESNITTPYGETLPVSEWLTDVEPQWDAAVRADAAGLSDARKEFIAKRKADHAENFPAE